MNDRDLESLPLEASTALAARFYLEPEWQALERERVFARSWQVVARADEVAAPGDHAVAEVAGTPVLVVRGEDGVLRACHNVCRHRAGPLAAAGGRGARSLRCRYHGWSYALDGSLRAAPEMEGAAGFLPEAVRLPEVTVREWQGLVLVALAAAPPLEAVLAGIVERIRPVELTALRFHSRVEYEVACNWKVYVDNYLEGYHLPHVHPGLSKVLDYRAYATELAEWHSLQHSPLRDAGDIYGDGRAWYYFVFPNLMLNIMPGRLQTNLVLPEGLDRCRVLFDFYFNGDGAARSARDLEFSDEIQCEDMAICERVQRGLASGGYVPGRLSPKREAGVWHFHELLRRAYTVD